MLPAYCKFPAPFDMEFRNAFNYVLCLLILVSLLEFVPYLCRVFAAFSMTLVGIKLTEWMMTFTRRYFVHKKVCSERKAVLITGCDSGFGNALARRMDKIGYRVFAACLNSDGKSAKDLIADCSEQLTVLSMDVTDDKSIQDAKEYITMNLGLHDLWAVVNNAGVGHVGQIDWTPFEEFQAVYDVNAAGVLRVTKAFLPLIKKSKGRIVNNNSISGRFHFPGFVGYCMSKSAAVALTTGLRIELAKWEVKAISIEAFFYLTPLTSTKTTRELVEKTWKDVPEAVKEEYGEEYKESFQKSVAQCLGLYCSPRISEVIDCFEDAITSEEPLSIYFPCRFIYKVLIKILLELPSDVRESFQKYQLEVGDKPAALMPPKM